MNTCLTKIKDTSLAFLISYSHGLENLQWMKKPKKSGNNIFFYKNKPITGKKRTQQRRTDQRRHQNNLPPGPLKPQIQLSLGNIQFP